jgi:hypothetical protein
MYGIFSFIIEINTKMRKLPLLISLFTFFYTSCDIKNSSSDKGETFKSYNLDFNWGEGGPNEFAEPGLWADANPKEHIKWYKDMGVNIVQTFIVSCNGYAWYKNGVVPEQPGLKHDFLPEMVRLGHKEDMKVVGYLCIGSNTRWGIENPEYSYGVPNDRHIPYTKKYLEYLDEIIRDAVKKTGVDGFMIDWFYQPNRNSNNGNWLDSEQERYEELMGQSFPGVNELSEEDYNAYSRLAIEECWNVIYKAAKETNPDCILWLTSFDIMHPHIVNSKMFKQVDWLMNEEGDVKKMDSVRDMVGKDTKLITCLANWNQKNPITQATNASKNGVGLYGFVRPNKNSLMPPIENYLSSPINSFSGDDQNIATLARIYNDLPLDYIKEKK